MEDSDADAIITNNISGTKTAFVCRNNQYFSQLYNSYTNYYEEACDCLIFPYSVFQGITL